AKAKSPLPSWWRLCVLYFFFQKPVGINNLGRKEFLSWAEFRDVFDRWCKKNKYLFKIKCYKTLSRTDSTSGKNTKGVKYSFIQLVCKYSVVNQCSFELLPPCQANIIVQAGPQHDRLIVIHSELDHNHEIVEEAFEQLFPRFMLKAKPFLFLEMASNISKQFLTLNDLQELVQESYDEEASLRDLLDELTLIFGKDPKVKIKLLFYPDTAEVEGIFLMTSAMRNLLHRFPSVLYIYQTMILNDDFYLYTAICEDGNQKGRTCGYFITRKESQTPARFMVVSLMQSIPEFVKYSIKTVVLHANLDELDLVETLLPNTTILMSQAHALKLLQSRIREEKRSVQLKMKKIICNLVFSSTNEKYKRNLRLLKATASASFLDYYLNEWHLHKESWVACWGLQDPRCKPLPHPAMPRPRQTLTQCT
uniref:MULE transposase domain-containing protein n=1 Tax=Xenopus tropicalis TaxID=8364 RepID=A0A6I8RNE3_XENTR